MITWQLYNNLTDYSEILDEMDKMVDDIIENPSHEKVLLVEHNNVYTAGTSAKPEELIQPRNIPVYPTGRGGKYTYHGPGQRVIYPILNLTNHGRQKDIKLYVKILENWMIASLAKFDIEAYIIPDKIGIWVKQNNQDAKIGAIGVRVKKWVTYHGIAININTDLTKFSGIIPCGLKNDKVTSIHNIGKKISMSDFDEALKQTSLNYIL